MSRIWDNKNVKSAHFHPKAKLELQEFPKKVRRELGKAIFDLQKGSKLGMPLSRSMPTVGIGVEELRMKDRSGIYRVFYFMKYAGAILVFHAFIKKTQATPHHEIELGKKRLREMLDEED